VWIRPKKLPDSQISLSLRPKALHSEIPTMEDYLLSILLFSIEVIYPSHTAVNKFQTNKKSPRFINKYSNPWGGEPERMEFSPKIQYFF
jgi:hypothetical protein